MFLGDSIGSKVDYHTYVSNNKIKNALLMRSDIDNSEYYQITAISEMTLSLLNGLLDGHGILNLDYICYYYRKWLLSKPSKIEASIIKALNPLNYIEDLSDCKGWSHKCQLAANTFNKRSEANISICIIAPLAIWCSRLENQEDLENAVQSVLSLTHPNEIVFDAGICYCLAIRHLIRNHGNAKGAYQIVKEWIFTKSNSGLLGWWRLVEQDLVMPESVNMDSLKIAWTYAFYYLKRGSKMKFLDILGDVISRGGDTCVNACIVGGMIGAAFGYNNLEKECGMQIELILNQEIEKNGSNRAILYSASEALSKIEILLEIAPIQLNMQ